MKYFKELQKAMSLLAQHPKTLFIGQAVEYEGTGLYDTVAHIPIEKGSIWESLRFIKENNLPNVEVLR
jgi:hypothetical protein